METVSYLVCVVTDGVTMVTSSECSVSSVSESEAKEVSDGKFIGLSLLPPVFSVVSAESAAAGGGGGRRGRRGR